MQPGRDANGRYVQSLGGAERDREAVRLRTRGCSYQQVSDQLRYGGWQNARRAVKATLAAVTREAAEEHVALQLEQLDALTAETLAVLEREHFVASAGRLVCDADGQPLLDDMPRLHAVARLLRIMERRAKLLGLDAPARHHVSASDTDIGAALAEWERELRRAVEVDVRRELEGRRDAE